MKRRIIIICAGLLMALPIVAQEFRPGVLAGLNLNAPSNMESRYGFRMGIKGELTFPKVVKGLYAESGLAISSLPWKSEKYIYPKSGFVGYAKAVPYFLNIPLRAGFKLNCGRFAKFYVNAGPYLNIGLFGNIKEFQGGVNNEPLPWYHEESGGYFSYVGSNHRVDWGLGFGTGIEVASHYQVSLGYEWGMRDIMKSSFDDRTIYDSRMRTFTLQLAYMF
ncbi:MAG: outer membrane beta-barrel protein [Prevotella sp.]|nr:outer membrane beta-barrel protein [Prevotella sp.]